jgi:hypothetical protein
MASLGISSNNRRGKGSCTKKTQQEGGDKISWKTTTNNTNNQKTPLKV